MIRLILWNFVFALAARVLQIAVSFALLMVIARYLPVEDFGAYSYIGAFTAAVMALSYFGVQNILTRDIAQKTFDTSTLYSTATALRGIMALLAASLLAALWMIGENGSIPLWIVLLAAASEAMLGYTLLQKSVLQGIERMGYMPVLTFIQSVSIGILAVGVIYAKGGYEWFFAAALLSNAAQFIAGGGILRRNGVRVDFSLVRKDHLKTFFAHSMMVGFAVILYKNLFVVNTLALKWLGNLESLAYFQAVHGLVIQSQILPMALSMAVFPAVSRLINKDFGAAAKILSESVKIMFFISAGAAAILWAFAGEVTQLVYGDKYAPSAYAMAVLAWALPALWMDLPLSGALVAMNRQKFSVMCAAVVLAANAALAFAFIPAYGFHAASWLALASYTLMPVCAVAFLMKQGVRFSFMSWAPQAGIPAAVCIMAALWLKPHIGLAASAVGGLVYVAGLFMTRGVSISEIKNLRRALAMPGKDER